MTISQGFDVRPARNGGFVVTTSRGPGYMGDFVGAFSTVTDMLEWLAQQYYTPRKEDPAAQAVVEAYRNVDREQVREWGAVTNDVPSAPRWITWTGGDCPVDDDTRVEVKYRSGDTVYWQASTLRWYHMGTPGDIVAYQVITTTRDDTPAEPGWITWNGGKCPVAQSEANETRVEVRFRSGDTVFMLVSELSWEHIGRHTDIVAYRVIK